MGLSLIPTPFDDPDWIFELKHDGFRALAYISDRNCELVSRRHNAYKTFESLRAVLSKLKVQNAILDGEIVCLDCEGRSLFNELLRRRESPGYYAFDLLWLNGRDLRDLPLIERKQRLRKLIFRSQPDGVICAGHIEGRGKALYAEVCDRDLEGIVCKPKYSSYLLYGQWLKVKNPNYSQTEGRRQVFDALRERSSRSVR